MKLLKLNLKAVGPFSGTVLDLSAGHERAASDLWPQRGGKDFGAAGDLAPAFRLSSSVVRQLRSSQRAASRGWNAAAQRWRRAARFCAAGAVATQFAARDDTSVVADQWQRRFLGELNQATFESLFGIDHERLSQAGEEIRSGKGTLGELLFAAGAGLAGLRRAQQAFNKGSTICSSREPRTRGSTRP